MSILDLLIIILIIAWLGGWVLWPGIALVHILLIVLVVLVVVRLAHGTGI